MKENPYSLAVTTNIFNYGAAHACDLSTYRIIPAWNQLEYLSGDNIGYK